MLSTRRASKLGRVLLGGAVLLGTTMLTDPAGAEMLSELKERLVELKAKVAGLEARQDREAAQAMVEPVIAPADVPLAGTFRSSYKLPGTNTSFNIGAFVKFDAHYTTMQGIGDSFGLGAVPFPGSAQAQSNGSTRFLARQSRIFVQTRTPTELGQIRTYTEGDFYGGGGSETATNGTGFRIRHAYGEIGNLLFGQTWSNFVIVNSYADTLDFNGPQGIWFARLGQIRYTYPINENWSLSASIENPQSAFIASAANPFSPTPNFFIGHFSGIGPNEDRIPDFTAKVTYNDSWGVLSLAGLFGVYDINTLATNASGATTILDETEPFFAVHGGGRIFLFGDDLLGFNFIYRDGAPRGLPPFLAFTPGSLGNSTFNAYVNVDATGRTSIENIEAFGGSIHYEHWWTDDLLSVAAYGVSHFDYPSQTVPVGTSRPTFINFLETAQSVHVNLRWFPMPRLAFGVEWMAGKLDFNIANAARAAGADDDTTVQRVQFSTTFHFF
jgi:hypothetical protein